MKRLLAFSVALLFLVAAWLIGYGGQDKARVRFAFYAESTSPVKIEMLHVTFSDGGNVRSVRGADFFTDETFGQPHSVWFDTPLSGTLTVTFSLVSPTGDVVSHGEFAIPLQPDWAWGVDFHATNHNPYTVCFGCFGYQAFPLDQAYHDASTSALYAIWGGNSIKNPVVY